MDEKTFGQSILRRLQPHFDIYREVHGQHFSGKTLLIDAVVVPRSKSNWKNVDAAFGIEFKNDLRLRGHTRNYTAWLAQCVDYANTDWDGFGYLYIFACPSLIDGLPESTKQDAMHWLLPRMMTQLGIGELKQDNRYGLTFVLQAEHRIWSERNGVESGRFWTLKRDFGAR